MSKNRGQSMSRRSRRANPFKMTSNQARRQAQGRGHEVSRGQENTFYQLPKQVEDNDE